MDTLPVQRVRERQDHWLELGVFGATIATIPQTILHLLGFSGLLIAVIDWGLWAVFLADLLNIVARAGLVSLVRPRGIAIAMIVTLSIPTLPTLYALIRLARLALVGGVDK